MTAARSRRLLAAALTVAAVASALVGLGVTVAPPAAAVTGAQWDAGNIISDSVFYDYGSMTPGQIQALLTDKGSSCQAANGLSCLKDYTMATPAREAEGGLCSGYSAASGESAATIIYNVARSCQISPRTLLVLLQKESSIVTRWTPSAIAYQSATGYGCPDTAACDSTYYGLFNQLYMAARQFKIYATYPTRYGYQAGRVNTILYNPDRNCGSSQVYIANQATAGLYTYTPYQPNAAALGNLYGAGDGCSAYGNRNFWWLFSDWFGDTQTGSFLLRSIADPAVYLVSGQTKYQVYDLATLNSLAPLGAVGFVSPEYLAGLNTGRVLGRFVRGPDGAVYLVDGSVLHQAPTCAMVFDYGDDCASTVPLTSTQVGLFTKGSGLTQLVSTTSGKTFYVNARAKQESYDDASLSAAGVRGPRLGLSEPALAALPYGAPIIRDDVLAVSRSDASVWLSRAGRFTNMPRTINAQNAWSRRLTAGLLDPGSINAVPHDPSYAGYVRSVDGQRNYLISPTGRHDLADSAQWSRSWATFSDSLLGAMPDEGPLSSPGYLKGAASDSILRIFGAVGRPVASFPALVALGRGQAPPFTLVAEDVAAALPRGAPLLQPGGLVIDYAGSVSLVDGTAGLVHLPTFTTAANLGLQNSYPPIDSATVAAYPKATFDLSTLVKCAGTTYLARGGTYQNVTVPASSALPVTSLSSLTCSALRLPAASSSVVSTEVFAMAEGAPTVYRVTAQGKQPVSNWDRLVQLNGGKPDPVIATLSSTLLAPIVTGAAL